MPVQVSGRCAAVFSQKPKTLIFAIDKSAKSVKMIIVKGIDGKSRRLCGKKRDGNKGWNSRFAAPVEDRSRAARDERDAALRYGVFELKNKVEPCHAPLKPFRLFGCFSVFRH